MVTITGAHFVGSLNTESAEESFELASTLTGANIARVPDGEFGERFHWILFQADRLAATPGLSRIPGEPYLLAGFDVRPIIFDGTIPVEEIVIPNLGYADAALDSYEIFESYKEVGKFTDRTRFQVSLPSVLAIVSNFFAGDKEERLVFEKIYAAALQREIATILEEIPHSELAIQFDCAVEFVYIEQADFPGYDVKNPWFGDLFEDAAARVAALVDGIPEDVEVGVHLCYGDVAEAHFVQPKDAENLTKFANLVNAKITRKLTWLHLPVPIERDDSAYFAPLANLQLDEGTELYLGLVHREDGHEGIERRVTSASEYVKKFGLSTECGFGRSPLDDRKKLFRLHKVVSN